MTPPPPLARRSAAPLLTLAALGFVLAGCMPGKPAPEPPPAAPPPQLLLNPEPTPEAARTLNLSYLHTVPGVFSEIFATVPGTPGEVLWAALTGPGGRQSISATVDGNGVATFVFRITEEGRYTVAVSSATDRDPFVTGRITVDPPQ